MREMEESVKLIPILQVTFNFIAAEVLLNYCNKLHLSRAKLMP